MIGINNAGTLMSYLPGDEPATKTDLVATGVLWSEFGAGFEAVVAGLEALGTRIDRLGAKFDSRMDDLYAALLSQQRTFVLATIWSIFATGALVAAITQAMS